MPEGMVPSAYRVVLKDLGSADPEAVVAAMESIGLDASQVQQIVAQTPAVLATGLDAAEAHRLLARLTEAGADAELVAPPPPQARVSAIDARRSQSSSAHEKKKLIGGALGLVALCAVAWLVIPRPVSLAIDPPEGATYVFSRSLNVYQEDVGAMGSVSAEGTIKYRIRRTVKKVAGDEILVVDRYEAPAIDLATSGNLAETYDDQVTELANVLPSVSVERSYDRKGKLRRYSPSALDKLLPWPAPVDWALGKLQFAGRGIKVGETWTAVVAMEDDLGVEFDLEKKGRHNGHSAAKARFKTVTLLNQHPDGGGDGFMASSDKQLQGTVWWDRKSGWPVDLVADLTHVQSSAVGGRFTKKVWEVRVEQTLESVE